jgi:hypothetical protein
MAQEGSRGHPPRLGCNIRLSPGLNQSADLALLKVSTEGPLPSGRWLLLTS